MQYWWRLILNMNKLPRKKIPSSYFILGLKMRNYLILMVLEMLSKGEKNFKHYWSTVSSHSYKRKHDEFESKY